MLPDWNALYGIWNTKPITSLQSLLRVAKILIIQFVECFISKIKLCKLHMEQHFRALFDQHFPSYQRICITKTSFFWWGELFVFICSVIFSIPIVHIHEMDDKHHKFLKLFLGRHSQPKWWQSAEEIKIWELLLVFTHKLHFKGMLANSFFFNVRYSLNLPFFPMKETVKNANIPI